MKTRHEIEDEKIKQFFSDLGDAIGPEFTLRQSNEHNKRSYDVIANKQHVGTVSKTWNSSSWDLRWQLEAKRIPSRGRYQSWRGGTRTYTKLDSVVKAIHKFCAPTSDAESDLKAASRERERLARKVRASEARARRMLMDGDMVNAEDVVRTLFIDGGRHAEPILRAVFWMRVHKRFATFMADIIEGARERENLLHSKVMDERRERGELD